MPKAYACMIEQINKHAKRMYPKMTMANMFDEQTNNKQHIAHGENAEQ